MIFDMNKAVRTAEMLAQELKWDVTVRLDERDYRVRPLELVDVEALRSIEGTTPPEDVVRTLSGLFVGEAPDFALLARERPEMVQAIGLAIGLALREHLKKKSHKLVVALEDQAAYAPPGR